MHRFSFFHSSIMQTTSRKYFSLEDYTSVCFSLVLDLLFMVVWYEIHGWSEKEELKRSSHLLYTLLLLQLLSCTIYFSCSQQVSQQSQIYYKSHPQNSVWSNITASFNCNFFSFFVEFPILETGLSALL